MKEVIVKHLKKLDIVNEINDLRSENKELYNKISMLQTLIKDKDEKTKTDIQQLQQEINTINTIINHMLRAEDLRKQIDILTKKTN